MNKPTPGPWVVNQNRPVAGCNGDIAITTKHESIVAVAFVRPGVEANARLIAAAPDYDEGARQAVEWLPLIEQDYPDLLGLIKALESLKSAIAKATGGK